jgi:hypothetical protein
MWKKERQTNTIIVPFSWYLVKHTNIVFLIALIILPWIRLKSATTMSPKHEIVSRERVEKSILLIRGLKVMLDADLAKLYGVSVKRLNEQVRRNLRRFPSDFMIHLTREEYEALESLDGKGKPLAGMLEHVADFRLQTGLHTWRMVSGHSGTKENLAGARRSCSRIGGKVNVCRNYRVHRRTTTDSNGGL